MNKNDALPLDLADTKPRLHSRRSDAFVCTVALIATDGLGLILSCCLSGFITLPQSVSVQLDIPGFIALACTLLAFMHWRHYVRRKPALRELRELLAVIVVVCFLHVTLLTLDDVRSGARTAGFMWFYAAFVLPSGRLLAKLVLSKLGFWQRDLVIIGSGRLAFDAAAAIASEPLMGLRVRGFVPVEENAPGFDAPLIVLNPQDVSRLGDVGILVAIEHRYEEKRNAWLRALASGHSANVMIVADMSGMPLHGAATTYVKSHELLMLQVRDNLSRWHIRFAKRVLDLMGALLISLALSPLLAFIAWRVRQDGGKAIYGHPRVGSDGRAFQCYKFRSMVVDANAVLADLLERDPIARQEWERDFKLRNDPRVTRIGRFLRRTSLDELPQLWNVIRGDMSLVGPRPIVEAELSRYGEDSCYYLMARPGMTGLWQVSGRNDADYPTRVYLDAWYVRNWSLWYDIAILFKTAHVVFRREGAY